MFLRYIFWIINNQIKNLTYNSRNEASTLKACDILRLISKKRSRWRVPGRTVHCPVWINWHVLSSFMAVKENKKTLNAVTFVTTDVIDSCIYLAFLDLELMSGTLEKDFVWLTFTHSRMTYMLQRKFHRKDGGRELAVSESWFKRKICSKNQSTSWLFDEERTCEWHYETVLGGTKV